MGTAKAVIRKELEDGMNLYEILIVTSVLCGFAAAFVAKIKGRSPLGWCVIGAILNVLALAVVVFAARSKLREG